jgi:hypothetical protein
MLEILYFAVVVFFPAASGGEPGKYEFHPLFLLP